MRKRMFVALMLSALAMLIGGSSTYVVAWRDGAARAAGEPYKQALEAAPQDAAQHAGHLTPNQELPVVVDGARNPERIPDWMAYRHFIRLNSLPGDAPPDAHARRDALLRRVGLSPGDRAALVRVFRGKKEALDAISQRRARLTESSKAAESRRRGLRLDEKHVFDTAQQEALGALSPEGAQQLARHIQDMKKSIVIRGSMPQF